MTADRELSRRRLLALSVAASVSAVAGLAPDAAEAAEQHPQVPRRVLGKTKQSIPILLLGGGAGFKGGFDSRISVALRHGVNYIDTARSYAGGTSEPHAAQTLHKLGARDKTWITSKSEKWSARSFARDVDFSLAELKTNWVDLYFLHGLDELEPLDDKALIRTVGQLKKAGKIRFFGFSCHGGNVAELLHAAAQRSFVDAVMFRYSFRDYGDKELNRAIDAAHRAGVGLIAMKTQGSEAGLENAWRKFAKTGKWNKHQAVLKAVWADQRISAAVSHMTTLEQLRQNIAAAVDRRELGALEWDAVRRYADATRAYACNGCDHLCSSGLGAPARIGDTLRYLMYHDSYGDEAQARALFRALPEEARRLEGVDWSAASRACPRGVDVALHMKRALRVLA
jgi:predicted aldo/keto reductase-like oxidoreductase